MPHAERGAVGELAVQKQICRSDYALLLRDLEVSYACCAKAEYTVDSGPKNPWHTCTQKCKDVVNFHASWLTCTIR